jgi:hypothetical protein
MERGLMREIIYKAKLKGKLDKDGETIFIGDTSIDTILPEHFDKNIFEVEVKVYEVLEGK